MTIQINGKEHRVISSSLEQVLKSFLEVPTIEHIRGVAVAVNGELVRRSEWNSHCIQDGDELEVLTATQGG